ncbi:hypothetical protein [Anabaena azotica]|uniref:hypothetical protein n=1 Tax=Anabaena azotica TaxID=197653 RepID=UPI001F55587F|nr:hypothetical protein [Anabaena azotica]
MPWDFRRGKKDTAPTVRWRNRKGVADRRSNNSATLLTQIFAFHVIQQIWIVLIFLTADLG